MPIVTTTTITLQVHSERLWDNLQAKSAFKARMIADAQLQQRSALAESDLPFVLTGMHQAANLAYVILARLMYGLTIDKSLWVNQIFTTGAPAGEDPPGHSPLPLPSPYPASIASRETRIAIVNNGMNNLSNMQLSEQAFYEIMEAYLLKEWYSATGQPEAVKEQLTLLQSAMQTLHNRSAEFYRIKQS